MQNFMPYSDFAKVAICLDYKRLGKQRLESRDTIYLCYRHKGFDKRIEFGKSDKQAEYLWRRYKNHPAVLMWISHINCLKKYYNTILQEWIDRDYKNNQKFMKINGKIIYPDFLFSKKFIKSHRSNLLRKNFEYYSKFGWNVKSNLPYIWPMKSK